MPEAAPYLPGLKSGVSRCENENQQALVTYIVRQLQVGQAPDEIAAQLKAANWSEDLIHQGFLTAQAQMLPTSMQNQLPQANNPVAGDQPLPQANGRRRGRIRTGWVLLKQSLKLLNGNRYLFRYLLMTWVVILIVEALMFVALMFGPYSLLNNTSGAEWTIFTFTSYVVVYFIINFYAAALAANILDIFKGQKRPYQEYIHEARAKIVPILVFSIIQAIVGTIISYVIERVRLIGYMVIWLLGTAWSLGTMFVIPIIVDNDTSAPKAIKQSISFFKQTWGEGVVAKTTVNAPLALLTLLLMLIFWPLLFITAFAGGYIAVILLATLYLFLQISLAIVGSFSNSVINVALYYYAKNHQIPPGFSGDMLNQVFVKRKHRFGKKARKDAAGISPVQ